MSILLTRMAFEAILNQIIEFEEKKLHVADEFFCAGSDAHSEFIKLMDDYLVKLEGLIEQAEIIDKVKRDSLEDINRLPFAIIGSTIEIETICNPSAKHNLALVQPYHTGNAGKGIPYLSPQGRELLLNPVGGKVYISSPSGSVAGIVKSVKFDLL